ncbi:hypothetical protein [Acinetobacter pseudolwoffii]|uniref:Uncharacterized protein n=1 Tax=Acinetobacter pseudolwoffii TaxID=2053287 RepID=A0A2H9YS59_9GAMM|nr:hypothetical protein [Acinetobacter pseudolwoffii]PJO75471.1 hypothetical protein CWI32_08030 [Acinetobacter pseudolwoffii]
MSTKKYQVRIRKTLTNEQAVEAFGEELAKLGSATQIRTITNKLDVELIELIEKIQNSIPDWEIISVILVDTDNSDQLGEDFEWDEEEA